MDYDNDDDYSNDVEDVEEEDKVTVLVTMSDSPNQQTKFSEGATVKDLLDKLNETRKVKIGNMVMGETMLSVDDLDKPLTDDLRFYVLNPKHDAKN